MSDKQGGLDGISESTTASGNQVDTLCELCGQEITANCNNGGCDE